MLGGNLSTLYTYEFRDQLPLAISTCWAKPISNAHRHTHDSQESIPSFDQLRILHSVYPEDVNLSCYKGLHCRSLVVTRILVRELSPRRRCLTHKNAKSTLSWSWAPLVLVHEGKETSANLHMAPRMGIFILDHYFDNLPFELFEWSEKALWEWFPSSGREPSWKSVINPKGCT